MAALGKIRSRGITLIVIIGLGLFAFIAEEAFRSCNGIKGEARQQVGEVLGEKINVQDFQKLVDEYQDAIKFTMQRDNLSESELNQVKDQVWQQMVTNRILEADAKKIGLTDEEIQKSLKEVKISNMRFQEIKIGNDIYINDAYNASPMSMKAAIDTLNEIYDDKYKIAILIQA